MKILKFFLLIPLVAMLFSCENGPVDPGELDDFDRQQMLANWADNIIIPAYTDFASKTAALRQASNDFADQADQAGLDELRSAWLDAYKSWQSVSMFEIGKAEEIALRNNLNIYPTDVDEVKENIEQGNYNLALPSELDQQGFPALDYLLHGLAATDGEILAFYNDDSQAESYKTYVGDLVSRIDELTQQVLADWKGSYRDAFVNNSGNSANASVDRLVNDYIFFYEKHLRAGKVGIPAGVFSGNPLPTHVEARYQGEASRELLLLALDAVQDFFNGKHYGSSQSGQSLNDYLDYLSTDKDGEQLSQLINAQFDKARNEIAGLNMNLSEQVEQDNLKMLSAYDQLQLNVVLLKVDMLQALNINVDFVDADGD